MTDSDETRPGVRKRIARRNRQSSDVAHLRTHRAWRISSEHAADRHHASAWHMLRGTDRRRDGSIRHLLLCWSRVGCRGVSIAARLWWLLWLLWLLLSMHRTIWCWLRLLLLLLVVRLRRIARSIVAMCSSTPAATPTQTTRTGGRRTRRIVLLLLLLLLIMLLIRLLSSALLLLLHLLQELLLLHG